MQRVIHSNLQRMAMLVAGLALASMSAFSNSSLAADAAGMESRGAIVSPLQAALAKTVGHAREFVGRASGRPYKIELI
jgi:hypothetical protein